MKWFFRGLMSAALLSGASVFAQSPAPLPAGPAVVIAPAAGACCPAGAPCTTCVPEQYMKKVAKTAYSSGCEPLCLCYYHGLFKSCGCESGHCEHPYTRRYLIKKVHTCEECATKCVPAAGASGCCVGPNACGGGSVPVGH